MALLARVGVPEAVPGRASAEKIVDGRSGGVGEINAVDGSGKISIVVGGVRMNFQGSLADAYIL